MTNMADDSHDQSLAYKLDFRLDAIFPPFQPLSIHLLRLMMAANDVRHIQKLALMSTERIDQVKDFDSVVLNGELLHLVRLLCGHLYEAGNAFRAIDGPRPELADSAVRGTEYEETLKRLREAYSSTPTGAFHHAFLKEVRDQFGFHYKQESIQSKLDNFLKQKSLDGTVIVAEIGGLSRYVVADHFMIGMLQDVLDAELPDLHLAFDRVMQKALSLAKDLGDVVDLLLLPLLEQDSAAIIKRQSGTLSIPPAIATAKHKVNKPKASGVSSDEGTRKESGI